MILGQAVMVLFACTSAIHLGLVSAVESALRVHIPIAGCAKCSTFWCVLISSLISGGSIITSTSVAFLMAYLALWLELAMCAADGLYNRIYDKVIDTAAHAASATGTAAHDAASPLHGLREEQTRDRHGADA